MIHFGKLKLINVVKFFCLIFFVIYILIININNGHELSNKFHNNLIKSDYSTSFIAHAGGGIDGKTYTNSLEALNNSINNSFKLIELDILVTDDGKIVAQHDFRILEEICNKNFFYDKEKKKRKKILFHEIKNCNKIFDDKYTLLKENQIIEIFENNKELILVTDKIDNYKLIYEKFKFQDRLIVEVFTIKDYFRAKFNGIKNPMFLFTDGRRNILYSVLFNIKLISISTANVKKYENFLKYLFRNKVSIYSFSSNSLEFNQKYIGQSITGVYTDFWSIDNFKCTEINKKSNACTIY